MTIFTCFLHMSSRKPLASKSKQMYILEGCRKVIGLDGYFLKTETKGQLLSVVGKDGNNQMFPISWAIIEGENQTSWTWFIQLLMVDLEISDGLG